MFRAKTRVTAPGAKATLPGIPVPGNRADYL